MARPSGSGHVPCETMPGAEKHHSYLPHALPSENGTCKKRGDPFFRVFAHPCPTKSVTAAKNRPAGRILLTSSFPQPSILLLLAIKDADLFFDFLTRQFMQVTKQTKSGWKHYATLLAFVLLIAPAGLVFAGPAEDAAKGMALYETKHYRDALPYLQKAAEAGDTKAQLYVGNMYREGLGVKKDYAKTIPWFEKAANAGDARAQTYLGIAYSEGLGVEPDYEKAAQWFLKAAEQNHGPAQTLVGVMYYKGMGVEQSFPEAKKWLEKASANGEKDAQSFLGLIYLEGGDENNPAAPSTC